MLFHRMDSPVYAVQVMLVCSIAGQLLGVAALWRAIDWRSLPAFLGGGILGVPARPTSPAATPPDLRTLAFVPAALLGAWFGLRIFMRLSDRQHSATGRGKDLRTLTNRRRETPGFKVLAVLGTSA
jgi:uncharacterized membrane protein YfcA